MSATSPPSTRTPPLGVRLGGVARRFGAVEAVAELDLAIAPGDFVALVGPSGCGKTTLLRLVGGLETPSAGAIDWDGAAAPPPGALSYCFQEPRLLPWRSVLRNVELPLEIAGVAPAERRRRALDAIARMRLDDAADRLPHALSGGMRMRASVARALVTKPRLLLLDEPFGAVDEVTRQELGEELRAIWEAERCTALLVTHSIPEAAYLAERVVVLSPRPARIVLDRRIDLGARRPDLRLEDAFASEVRILSETLYRTRPSGGGDGRS